MRTIFLISCFLPLYVWINPLHAQTYLSLENERRMIRKKAFVGDEIRFSVHSNPEKFSRLLDSIAMDGFFRADRLNFQVSEIRKVWAQGPFSSNERGKRFLGALLTLSSIVYMGGTLVNGWILENPAQHIDFYKTPLALMGVGVGLYVPWRSSYRLGNGWKLRVMQY